MQQILHNVIKVLIYGHINDFSHKLDQETLLWFLEGKQKQKKMEEDEKSAEKESASKNIKSKANLKKNEHPKEEQKWKLRGHKRETRELEEQDIQKIPMNY